MPWRREDHHQRSNRLLLEGESNCVTLHFLSPTVWITMENDRISTSEQGLLQPSSGVPVGSYQTDEEEEEEFFWRFTDFGEVGETSRDGSPHATDEVFNSVSHLAGFFLSVLASALLIAESSAQSAFTRRKSAVITIFGGSRLDSRPRGVLYSKC